MTQNQTRAGRAAAERRATPRYEVNAYVDLSGPEVYLKHRVINISLGGLCIQVDSSEEIGTEVDLLIHFPDLSTSLSTKGHVQWVNRDHPMDMGIRFTAMEDRKQETLKQYLTKAHLAGAVTG